MTGQRLVIIVTLSLTAAIVLLSVTCYVFKDDLVRMTTKSALRTFYNSVAADTSLHSVDTVALGRILRTFSSRVDSINLGDPKFAAFMTTMYEVYKDRKVSVADVDSSVAGVIGVFPDLAPLWRPIDSVSGTATARDSAAMTAPVSTTDTVSRHPDSAAMPGAGH